MKIYQELTDIKKGMVLLFMILFKSTICDLMLTPHLFVQIKNVNNSAVGILFFCRCIFRIYLKNIAMPISHYDIAGCHV
jgi:hypothetical protein